MQMPFPSATGDFVQTTQNQNAASKIDLAVPSSQMVTCVSPDFDAPMEIVEVGAAPPARSAPSPAAPSTDPLFKEAVALLYDVVFDEVDGYIDWHKRARTLLEKVGLVHER